MDEELIQLFREGALENLVELEEALLKLGDNSEDQHEIDRVFRVMHTIKGSAGMIGLNDVASFAHHLETEFDKIRNREVKVTPLLTKLALKARDQISAMIDAHYGGAPSDEGISLDILSEIKKVNVVNTESEKKSSLRNALLLIQECVVLLNRMSHCFGDLELIGEFSHSLHALREMALAEGLESILEFSCEFEKLFNAALKQEIFLNQEVISLTKAACDEMRIMFEDAIDPNPLELMDSTKIMESLQRPLAIIETLKSIRDTLEKKTESLVESSRPVSKYRIRIFLTRRMLEKGYTVEFFLDKLRTFGQCTNVGTNTGEQIAIGCERNSPTDSKISEVA